MAITVERRDGRTERQVIIGMIVSRAVLGPVAARWEKGGIFASKWANLVGGWAVDHYRRYKRPPGRDIEGYFEEWAATARDAEVAVVLDDLLAGLSEEYARMKRDTSPEYLLDQAGAIADRTRVARLRDELEVDLENGDVAKAMARIRGCRPIEVGLGSGIIPMEEDQVMVASFEERGEDLIEYPGALGNFFWGSLGREQFISFMGKEKVGKSFWLLDLACRAVEQQRSTAYFEVGDNTQAQVLRRLACRLGNRPIAAGPYQYPIDLDDPPRGQDILTVITEEREAKYEMDGEEAVAIMKAVRNRVGSHRLRLSCHPNSSISVLGIEAILEGWAQDGWRPDVVVIDYSDILAPLDGRADTRDQINASWKALRAMSQKWHCLLVTATQTDTDSYSARVLKRENFSEDKRKYAHVTGMVGINQGSKEKDVQLFRLNWVLRRELAFSEEAQVATAACLSCAQPAVVSRIMSH